MPEEYGYSLELKPEPVLIVLKNLIPIKRFKIKQDRYTPVELLAERFIELHAKNLIN